MTTYRSTVTTRWLTGLAILLATALAYARVCSLEFVSFDDHSYVLDNPEVRAGLTASSIRWAFTSGYTGNWHPLTWLSHMLDVELFGLHAGGHHAVNLCLHLLNTMLLFVLLCRLTAQTAPSAFVAALFALHPLHVESVAWVAERKDVLSTTFWMLSMHGYVSYARSRRAGYYVMALLAFALGLLAKPMLVTLPLVLLMMDYWPLGRLEKMGDHRRLAALLTEKAPFLLLAIVSSIVTLVVQSRGGTVSTLVAIPVGARIANAVEAYAMYLADMLWPTGLVCFHPFDSNITFGPVAVILFLLLAEATVLAMLASRRRYFTTGWLWYVITLLPVIGLVQVGLQSRADRYTYVPLIGIFLIVAWGCRDLVSRWPRLKAIAAFGAFLLPLGLGVLTSRQVSYWRNSITLYEHALAVSPENWFAHQNLGSALAAIGDVDRALAHYQESLRLRPDNPEVHYNLGNRLFAKGGFAEAVDHYRDALELEPDHADAERALPLALLKKGEGLLINGEPAAAIPDLREALALQPGIPQAHYYLGLALSRQDDFDAAAEEFAETIRLKPDWAAAHNNLGAMLLRQQKTDAAIDALTNALTLKPDLGEARYTLGLAFAQRGDLENAAANLALAVQAAPRSGAAHYQLARVLEQQGKTTEANAHYEEAKRLLAADKEERNRLEREPGTSGK